MKAGPKSSLRPFLHRALQLFHCICSLRSVNTAKQIFRALFTDFLIFNYM